MKVLRISCFPRFCTPPACENTPAKDAGQHYCRAAPEYQQKRHGNSTGPLAPTGPGRPGPLIRLARAGNQAGKEKKCETRPGRRAGPGRFTSTEVVYGVTGTGVTELPEYGVSP